MKRKKITNSFISFYRSKSNTSSFLCIIDEKLVALYITGTNFVLSNIIPFCIMLSSTSLITHYLITQKSKLRQNVNNYKREKDFIKSTLTMVKLSYIEILIYWIFWLNFQDIWFIICFWPLTIMDLIQYLIDSKITSSVTWQILQNIFVMLSFVYTSCNFFVMLICNKIFRNQFKSIISWNQNSVTPLTTTTPVGRS